MNRVISFLKKNYGSLIVLFLLLGFLFWQRYPQMKLDHEIDGKPASDFVLFDTNGKLYRLSDLKGKYVLLNFWATWCAPCRIEIPMLNSLARDLLADKFVLLAITAEDPGIVKKFLEENPVSFPVLLDTDGKVTENYKVLMFPTNIFLGTDHIVSSIDHGLGLLLTTRIRWKVAGRLF